VLVLDTSVFVIPSQHVKNGEERLVVLNRVAISAVKSQRGLHPVHVFVRECEDHELRPVAKIYGTTWKGARRRTADVWSEQRGEPAPEGFREIRVHDLKRAFG